jgi:hypothetical protein
MYDMPGAGGGHEERAKVLGQGGAGPAHADLDKRRRVPAHQLRGAAEVPDGGSRRVSVIFDVPSEPAAMRTAEMPSR